PSSIHARASSGSLRLLRRRSSRLPRVAPRARAFLFYGFRHHPDLHSFPTRRSSDLAPVLPFRLLWKKSCRHLSGSVFHLMSIHYTAASISAYEKSVAFDLGTYCPFSI